MPLVLYPEQLSAAGRVYDEACAELKEKGARFSAEALARRVLELVSEGLGAAVKRKVLRRRTRVPPDAATLH